MAQPTAPQDLNGVNTGFGIWNNGGTATPAWPRMLAAAIVGTETTQSGALSVGGMVVHDAVDTATIGPLKVGGYAKATAPTVVSADADIVNAWFALNGALHVIPTGGGGLAGIADDAAFTPATSGVVMGGFFADETATDSVDEGDGGAARMTLDRKQIVAQYAHTTGGWTPYSAISTAAVHTAEIKGSAGQIGSLQCFNNGANEVFVRLYNQTGAPGSSDAANIVWRGMIPGNAAGAGVSVPIPIGIPCATGIGIRATGLVADDDTTALAANEVLFNVQYK